MDGAGLDVVFTWGWVAWGAWFLVWEGWALARKGKGDTLSEHVWHWQAGGWARKLFLGGFLAWLVLHFLGEGKWG